MQKCLGLPRPLPQERRKSSYFRKSVDEEDTNSSALKEEGRNGRNKADVCYSNLGEDYALLYITY